MDTGFRKRSCSTNNLKRDDDWKKSHLASGPSRLLRSHGVHAVSQLVILGGKPQQTRHLGPLALAGFGAQPVGFGTIELGCRHHTEPRNVSRQMAIRLRAIRSRPSNRSAHRSLRHQTREAANQSVLVCPEAYWAITGRDPHRGVGDLRPPASSTQTKLVASRMRGVRRPCGSRFELRRRLLRQEARVEQQCPSWQPRICARPRSRSAQNPRST